MRHLHRRCSRVRPRARGLRISFDPLDKFQDWDLMGSSKKPLPGERRPVFPEGVPGVPQGVPPEMVKGYQPPPEAPPPVVEAKPARPKPKKTAAAPRRAAAAAARAAAEAPAAAPTHAHPAGAAGRRADGRPCRARSRPGRPTRRQRRGPGSARSADHPQSFGYRRPRASRRPEHLDFMSFTLAIVGTAERRQIDAVQPPGRQAARAGRRPAGRDARPARGRGAPRRSRFTVVDTAGFDEAAPDSLIGRMMAQTELAIEQRRRGAVPDRRAQPA